MFKKIGVKYTLVFGKILNETWTNENSLDYIINFRWLQGKWLENDYTLNYTCTI